MQKEAHKAQQAEQKKLDKQKADWDSGKDALKSIVAEIDSAIIETGSIGGILNPDKSSLSYQNAKIGRAHV